MYCSGAQQLSIEDSVLINNSASRGGAVFLDACSAYVVDSQIVSNEAEARGGAFFVNDSYLSIRTSEVGYNDAGSTNATNSRGGGLYSRESTVHLTDTAVIYNQATGLNAYGGGAFLYYSTMVVSGATSMGAQINGGFGGNLASSAGGGVALRGPSGFWGDIVDFGYGVTDNGPDDLAGYSEFDDIWTSASGYGNDEVSMTCNTNHPSVCQ